MPPKLVAPQMIGIYILKPYTHFPSSAYVTLKVD